MRLATKEVCDFVESYQEEQDRHNYEYDKIEEKRKKIKKKKVDFKREKIRSPKRSDLSKSR